MVIIKCPLCGADKFKSVFRDFGYDRREYSVVRCEVCAFCYTNPQPSNEELSEIYSSYYGGSKEIDVTREALAFRKPVFEEVCSLIEPFRKDGSKLLDIGCGNGDFIFLAREKGWNVSG